MFARFRSFTSALLRRRRAETEMAEEWQFHLDERIDALVRAGLSPAEAKRRARLEFGNPVALRDTARQARGLQFIDDVRADLRYAFRRLLRHQPGSAAIVVVGLALAIAVNVVAFSFVNALALRSPGIADPSSAVHLRYVSPNGGERSLTIADYHQLRERARLLLVEATTNETVEVADVSGELPAQSRVQVRFVTGRLFQTFGMKVTAGRPLVPGDDAASAPPVAVLSHGYWIERFDANPDVVGQVVLLSGTRVTVVGIADRASTGPFVEDSPAIWLPMATGPRLYEYLGPFTPTSNTRVGVVARLLTPGTGERAAAEATGILSATNAAHAAGETTRAARIELTPLGGPPADGYVASALFLAFVGLILVLGSTNAANFLLASITVRQHEVATRRALGASGSRVATQLLIEGLVLASVAGVFGLILATWTLPAVARLMSSQQVLPPGTDVFINWHACLYAVTISALAGLLAGLAGTRYATRGAVTAGLKAGGTSQAGRRHRMRSVLVGVQATAAIVVLVFAVALGKALIHTASRDAGFDLDNVATITGRPSRTGILASEIAAYARTLPMVADAAETTMPPFFGGYHPQRLYTATGALIVDETRVSSRYFSTLGIPLTAGRSFDDTEVRREDAVAVVSQSIARAIGISPGAVIRLGDFRQPAARRAFLVIGVARDVSTDVRPETAAGAVYVPLPAGTASRAVIRMKDSAALAGPAIRDAMLGLDPGIRVQPLVTSRDARLAPLRAIATLTSLLGALAFGLAVAGVFAVTTYAAAQRLPEVTVRLALGATPTGIRRMLLSSGLRPVAIGLLVGTCIAVPGMWMLSRVFYGIGAVDPLALGTAVGLLIAASVCAGLVPAIRAARSDPAQLARQA